ncbi:MAG: peptidase M14 [Algicola sp.]|nr:peptidase M14 [Algicola sp.]
MRLFIAAVLSSLLSSLCLLFSITATAQSLDDFFPEPVSFNPDIPTPESVLGYQVGDWHVGHDQLVNYMKVLAEKSDRINLEVMGYSHEQRPLLLLTIAHPDKLKNVEQIRQRHIARMNNKSAVVGADDPAIVWMGYSVHGNEASGTNASLLFAYYLAAAQGPKVEKTLNELVILLDPSLNPDGLNRFASWVNSHKGSIANADPRDIEHNESWPQGRTNHYWFDLNRDWLLLRHPESRARVAKFHHWKPNVLTDSHEMGPNNSFFFQPGIGSRKNPWTPTRNVELTRAIASHHVKSFDKQGVMYFTEESFDDFYYGKGSTYPDVNGGVGILYEQASARGFVQNTVNGKLTFQTAISNQLSASLSTLEGAKANRQGLLEHQRDFYTSFDKLADEDDLSGYIVSEAYDKTRLFELLTLLQSHQIEVYQLSKNLKVNSRQFDKNHSYYIPLAQRQYRLIKSIFSQRKSFNDNTFYDVSSWNLAYAFNIVFEPINSSWGLKYNKQPWQKPSAQSMPQLGKAYSYAFEWDDSKAPLLLSTLLADKLSIRVATKGFTAKVKEGQHQFSAGTIVINRILQKGDRWLDKLQQAQQQTGVKIFQIRSGWTSSGVDLGSRSVLPVHLPKVLLVGGRGTTSYEVGEIWHFLNKQLALAPTIVERDRLGRVDFSKYTHMILANGDYDSISEATLNKLKRWIKSGGVIWGQKKGALWLAKKELLKASYITASDMGKRLETEPLSYGEKDALAGRKRIAGAIFSVDLDLSHPLAYGYQRSKLPVFKNSTFVIQKTTQSFVAVAKYGKYPQLSGYADKTNVNKIAESTYMLAHSLGRGLVIGVADNVNFRGFWYGTSRLMSNSLFFAGLVKAKAE